VNKNLIVLLLLAFAASGCATLEYQGKINTLEGQVEQLRSENTSLKDKVAALGDALTDATKKQKVVLKAPTGRDIQTALKNAGFYQGEIDGKIGSKTKGAVMKFQEANGLNPDGSVGSRTWEKLSEHLKQE
jgi:peptidoglycan hydrolase-like protein with peptidoglycan-binding domain